MGGPIASTAEDGLGDEERRLRQAAGRRKCGQKCRDWGRTSVAFAFGKRVPQPSPSSRMESALSGRKVVGGRSSSLVRYNIGLPNSIANP